MLKTDMLLRGCVEWILLCCYMKSEVQCFGASAIFGALNMSQSRLCPTDTVECWASVIWSTDYLELTRMTTILECIIK